jgi:hypothetical protein
MGPRWARFSSSGHGGGKAERGPLCRAINASCKHAPSCPAVVTGRPCWSVADVACCSRNDKSRCCYCSVYLAYLDYRETRSLRAVTMRSTESARFRQMGKRVAQDTGDLRILGPEDEDT